MQRSLAVQRSAAVRDQGYKAVVPASSSGSGGGGGGGRSFGSTEQAQPQPPDRSGKGSVAQYLVNQQVQPPVPSKPPSIQCYFGDDNVL
jgi:hypothetical protein